MSMPSTCDGNPRCAVLPRPERALYMSCSPQRSICASSRGKSRVSFLGMPPRRRMAIIFDVIAQSPSPT